MKKTILILTVVIAMVLVVGCKSIDSKVMEQKDTEYMTPSPTKLTEETPQKIESDSKDDIESDSKDDILEINISNTKVLRNGITLEQIGKYISMDYESVLRTLGGSYMLSDSSYYCYKFKDEGIQLIKLSPYDTNDKSFDIIECYSSSLCLLGINDKMNYEQIKSILGETKTVEVNKNLGMDSYELRYIINGVKIKFSSLLKDGRDFKFSIVEEYDSGFDFILITPEQIEKLFSMKLQDYVITYGDEFKYYNDYEGYFLYGNLFRFNNDDFLVCISFKDNYEVAGVRYDYTLENVMEVLGEKEIKIDFEEDAVYSLTYEYNNFKIEYTTIWEIDDSLIDISVLSTKYKYNY